MQTSLKQKNNTVVRISESAFNKKYEEAIKEFLCNCIQILSIICSQSKEEQSNIFDILLEAYFSGLQEIENQISNQRNEDDLMLLPLLNAIEKARHYADRKSVV